MSCIEAYHFWSVRVFTCSAISCLGGRGSAQQSNGQRAIHLEVVQPWVELDRGPESPEVQDQDAQRRSSTREGGGGDVFLAISTAHYHF